MGDAMIGVGILLVMIGPLLNIPIIWLLHHFGFRRLPAAWLDAGPVNRTLTSVTLSTLVLGGLHLAAWLPGKLAHQELCEQDGRPVIHETVLADGYYRSRMAPYEARRYLVDDGFAFVEAPHMYEKGRFVRYSLNESGEQQNEVITDLLSRYEIEVTDESIEGDMYLSRRVARDRATGRELGRATQISFNGGRLSLLLGTGAMSSCPDPGSDEGSEDFLIYYHFAREVLRRSPGASAGQGS